MSDSIAKVLIVGDASAYNMAVRSAAAETDAAALQMNAATDRVGGMFSKMGSALSNISPILGAPFEKLGKSFDDAEAHGNSAMSKLSTIGGASMLGLGAAVAGVGVVAVKMGMDYQSTVTKIAANSGITVKAAQDIGNAFLSTAGTTIYSAQSIASAYSTVGGQLKTVEGHALTSAQALNFMKTAMDLAEGSSTNLDSATSILSTTLRTFSLGLSSTTKVSDILFSTSQATGTSMETVAQAIDTARAQAGAAAPPLAALSSLILDLQNHGEVGSRALRSIGTALTGVLTPTAKVLDAQKALGLSFLNTQGQMLPIRDIIGELQPLLKGMGESQGVAMLKTIGFGNANSKLYETFLAGIPGYDKASDAANRVGAAHEAAMKQAQTLGHQFDLVSATVKDYVTELGEHLVPVIETVIGDVAKVVTWFEHHKDVAIALAAVVGGGLVVAMGVFTAGLVSSSAAFLAGIAPATAFGGAMKSVALTFDLTGETATAMAANVKFATTESGVAVDALAAQIGALRTEAAAPITMGPVVPEGGMVGAGAAGAGEAGAAAGVGAGAVAGTVGVLGSLFGAGLILAMSKSPDMLRPNAAGNTAWNAGPGTFTMAGPGGRFGPTSSPMAAPNPAEQAQAQTNQLISRTNSLLGQIHGDEVKDATAKSQGATFQGMMQQLNAIKTQDGANSPQYLAALKGAVQTADKWYPEFARDKTAAEMNATIGKQFEQALQAKQALENLTKDQTLKAADTHLSGLQMQLLNEQKSGASTVTIAATRGLINQELGHIAAIHTAQDKLAKDTTMINNEKSLESALNPKLAAISTSLAEPRKSTVGGSVMVVF